MIPLACMLSVGSACTHMAAGAELAEDGPGCQRLPAPHEGHVGAEGRRLHVPVAVQAGAGALCLYLHRRSWLVAIACTHTFQLPGWWGI